jgi:hypothetical protein
VRLQIESGCVDRRLWSDLLVSGKPGPQEEHEKICQSLSHVKRQDKE